MRSRSDADRMPGDAAAEPPGIPLPFALLIERLAAATLSLDPDTAARLAALDGAVVRVHVTSPTLQLTLIVNEGKVSVPTRHDGDVDLTITGSAAALRSLAGSTDALHRGKVTLHGDLRLARVLRELVAGLDPDWQSWVAPLTGDAVVHRLDRASGQAARWWRRTREAFQGNARDWLEDEVQAIATPEEVRRLCDDVDAVRAQADRLDARLSRLERRRSDGNGSHSP